MNDKLVLDETALNDAARAHDHWTGGSSTIGSLNAIRNTREIVRAYLSAAPSPSIPEYQGLVEKARDFCRYPNIHFHYQDGPQVMGALADAVEVLTARAEAAEQSLSEARDKALEEAAQAVEAFTPIRPAFETEDEGGQKWPHPAEQMPIYQPEKLATAIRALKSSTERKA